MVTLAAVALAASLQTIAPSRYIEGPRSNAMQDAVARAADEARTMQKSFGPFTAVKVMQNRLVGGSYLQQIGILRPAPGTYLLVQVRTVFRNRFVELQSYAYDPVTHFVRYEAGRIVTPENFVNPPCQQLLRP